MAYRTSPGSFGFSFMLTPWVKKLLIANVVITLLTVLAGPVVFGGFFVRWFGFHPLEMLFKPWGAVTYMFLHGGIGHLLINMLVVFFFGPPLEQRWGSQEFIRFYIICGLGGAALSFLFSPGAPIIGASAAVYGLLLAFAMNWPNAPIYVYAIFPVPAKWLVGFMFVVSFLSAVGPNPGDGIAHMAHLGGILAGFIYLKSDWRPGAKLSRWKREAKKRSLMTVPDGGKTAEGRKQDQGRRGRRAHPSEEKVLDAVDKVLDKISAEGMSSLTEEERRLLDEVSRQRRSN